MRRNLSEPGDRLVRQKRQDQAGEDQEFAGGDDLPALDAASETVQLFPRGQQEDRANRSADSHPGWLSEGNWSQQIRQDIADRYHQPDIGAPVRIDLLDMAPVVAGEPSAEHEQPGAQRQQMLAIESIKQPARERQ